MDILGLASVAHSLEDMSVPFLCESDDGEQLSNHWSETKDAMEEELEGFLDSYQITLLSLSRLFGPMPEVDEEEHEHLLSFLRKENPIPITGAMRWVDLAHALENYAAK